MPFCFFRFPGLASIPLFMPAAPPLSCADCSCIMSTRTVSNAMGLYIPGRSSLQSSPPSTRHYQLEGGTSAD